MRSRSVAIVVALVLVLGAEATARTWRWRHRLRSSAVHSIVSDPNGNLYALSHDVVKIDGRSGAVRWLRSNWGPSNDITIADDGDPVVAGEPSSPGAAGPTFGVLRRSARTGGLVWRFDADGSARASTKAGPPVSYDGAISVEMTPDGDVVAGGMIDDELTRVAPCVIRLAGSTGRERWRRCWTEGSGAAHVHVESNGDVVASLPFTAVGRRPHVRVVRLAGADGAERWSLDLPGVGMSRFTRAGRPTPTPDGHLIIAGSNVAGRPIVIALENSATGAFLWQWTGDEDVDVRTITVLPGGDVVAAGFAPTPSARDGKLLVVRLDGSTGAQEWAQTVFGGWGEGARDVTFVPPAALWVAGGTSSPKSGRFQLLGLALDADTGTVRREVRLPPFSRGYVVAAAGDSVLIGGEVRRGRGFIGELR